MLIIMMIYSIENGIEDEQRSRYGHSKPFYATIDLYIVPDYQNHLHQQSDLLSFSNHLQR